MEQAIVLVLVVSAALFTSLLYSTQSSKDGRVTSKHGHRCYAENLNEFEQEVVRILQSKLDSKDYFIFNNLILPSRTHISTQIDHVIVSRFGIFVLESKDLGGWIFGNRYDESWTQVLWHAKYSFRNPLRQNFGHVRSISEQLGIGVESIHGVVVFSDRGQFRSVIAENVLKAHELIQFIVSFDQPVLPHDKFYSAIGKLSYLCQALNFTDDQHIENVRAVISRK